MSNLPSLSIDFDVRADLEAAVAAKRVAPDASLRKLVERTSAFRAFAQFGRPAGDELTHALDLISELSVIDGSIGWLVAQATLGQIVVGSLPDKTLEELAKSSPPPVIAGSFAPKGRISRCAKGWRVNGHWPLVTGCDWADWIYVNAYEFEGRRIRLGADGNPANRIVMFKAMDVEIVRNWDALGLCNTGSHDIRIENQICPDANSFVLCNADNSDGLTPATYSGLFGAAVAVGVAKGAIAEFIDLVRLGKRPTFSNASLADDPHVHEGLGEASLKVAAAEAMLARHIATVQQALREGASALARAELKASPRLISMSCEEAVRSVFRLSSSNSVRLESPTQRRLRDLTVIGQHTWNSWSNFAGLGRALIDDATGSHGKSDWIGHA